MNEEQALINNKTYLQLNVTYSITCSKHQTYQAAQESSYVENERKKALVLILWVKRCLNCEPVLSDDSWKKIIKWYDHITYHGKRPLRILLHPFQRNHLSPNFHCLLTDALLKLATLRHLLASEARRDVKQWHQTLPLTSFLRVCSSKWPPDAATCDIEAAGGSDAVVSFGEVVGGLAGVERDVGNDGRRAVVGGDACGGKGDATISQIPVVNWLSGWGERFA